MGPPQTNTAVLPGRRADGVPLSAEGSHFTGPAPALVSLSPQPLGQLGGDALLHRADRDLWAIVGLRGAATASITRGSTEESDQGYLLVPHDAITGNMTTEGLASRYALRPG
jgi:hypothetical protein